MRKLQIIGGKNYDVRTENMKMKNSNSKSYTSRIKFSVNTEALKKKKYEDLKI